MLNYKIANKVLKTAEKCYQPEFGHIWTYSSGVQFVTDRYRIYYTKDLIPKDLGTIVQTNNVDFKNLDIQKIIPTEFDYQFKLEVTNEVKFKLRSLVHFVKKDYNKEVRFDIQNDKMTIKSNENKLMQIELKLIISDLQKETVEPILCGFNVNYICDFLLECSGTVEWRGQLSNKPDVLCWEHHNYLVSKIKY